jgi:hypothetical protein
VIASTAAVNLKDWEPNRSVLAHPDNQAAASCSRTARAQTARPRGCLGAYEALALEPGFALASKRAGDCARARQDGCGARALSGCRGPRWQPLPRDSEQNWHLLGRPRHQVPVVDGADPEAATPDRLLGFELM